MIFLQNQKKKKREKKDDKNIKRQAPHSANKTFLLINFLALFFQKNIDYELFNITKKHTHKHHVKKTTREKTRISKIIIKKKMKIEGTKNP